MRGVHVRPDTALFVPRTGEVVDPLCPSDHPELPRDRGRREPIGTQELWNIAGGEQLETVREIQTFLEPDALDVLQPTAVFVGGITELITIAQLAERFSVPVAPLSVQHV